MAAKPASPAKRPSRKRSRGLLKIASLGIAGLIAGLLSGCSVARDVSSLPLSHYHIAGHLDSGHGTRTRQ
jgi:hypothetical protein